MRANAPQVVFLSIEHLQRAKDVFHGIREFVPGAQVVAVGRNSDPAILLDLMHIGVREFLAYPFDATNFHAAMSRLQEIVEKMPVDLNESDKVISFLPAKPGAGTSTIAMNTAVALSRHADTNTLLMDLDLNSGLIGFMMKLDNVYSIYEAADSATKLDEHLWPQLVASVGKLDVLPAGRLDPQTRVDPVQIRQLISFARRFYKSICIDLSGNMEKFSIEVMQESKHIFLVCTPEIPALHLARQKYQLLQKLELGDRVSVLLNRMQRRTAISKNHIEQLLGAPVYKEFPNDYFGVHKALSEGAAVNAKSDLGKQFHALSSAILEKSVAGLANPKKHKKKFLEYFSVLPTRAPSN